MMGLAQEGPGPEIHSPGDGGRGRLGHEQELGSTQQSRAFQGC